MPRKSISFRKNVITLFCAAFCVACTSPKKRTAEQLYGSYCASCHLAPSIEDLPKAIWEKEILPDMAARMGIREPGYDPLEGKSFREQEVILKTGIYPHTPIISLEDWALLKNYVLSLAPDSLRKNPQFIATSELSQFAPKPISLDSDQGALITCLKYDESKRSVMIGDISGNLMHYSFITEEKEHLAKFGNALSDYTNTGTLSVITAIGHLNPSDISSGRIFVAEDQDTIGLSQIFHRPVHTLAHDFDKNGTMELVVSEFGNLTGKLSLLYKGDSLTYQKKSLLTVPGTIRVLAEDMDADGKDDLIVLTAQGDEGISILYQEDDLQFNPVKVIQLSPLYGISWFEMIDYDGDGDQDIVIANGDNADKSYVHKPYHGMRIFINDGQNNFEEKYFYALNGATRVVAGDFDDDGDFDFGLLSTFPDYNKPEFSFVYLENKNAEQYSFVPHTFEASTHGRWLLMDAADVDEDGDTDILLSSFTYAFTPVPEHMSKLWKEKNIDIMFLENKLKTQSQ
ncbi:FG-GAP repeat domain-containing protein [Spongiimicrobium sp. 3-5]|uniref:FG-GAP repeat domain-containing protein n=1 Tax=Spongiimicrobium sp. 3-5 TaxID=3332596 RepID=UPI00398000D8